MDLKTAHYCIKFTEKETILNLQLLKSKIENDLEVNNLDVPLLKSTDEINETTCRRFFEEIINSPIYRYVISKTQNDIVVYLKKDKRYVKIKDKYFDQIMKQDYQEK